MNTINDLYTKIGEIIKKKRIEKNFDRNYLADGICSVTHLRRIENGERCPNPIMILQLCSKLEISFEMFFSYIYVDDINKYNELSIKFVSEFLRHNYLLETKLHEERRSLCSSEIPIYPNDKIRTNLVDGIKTNNFESNIAFIEKNFPQYSKELLENINLVREEMTHITNAYLLLHIFNNQSSKVLEIAETYFKEFNNISFSNHINVSIYIEIYIILSLIYNDTNRFSDSLPLIDTGIEKCKKYSLATLIPIFYYIRGETLYFSVDKETGLDYIKRAFMLHSEICPDYDDFLVPNIRLKQKNISINLNL